MTKIIIPHYGNGLNRGSAALLSSRIRILKEYIPNSKFTIFAYNPELDPGIDKDFIKNNEIKFYEVLFKIERSPKIIWQLISIFSKLILWPVICKLKLNFIIRDERFNELAKADIIISTGGDVLTEDYGTLSYIFHMLNLFYGLLFKIPVVVCAESIGPFKKKINQVIANYLFNKASLITLRENISKKHLDDLMINKPPIFITNDFAFLLEPASNDRIQSILLEHGIKTRSKPLIGISLSKIISHYGFLNTTDDNEKYLKYIQLMAQVIDYLTTEFNSNVILVPHVMEPKNDDRDVNKDVYKLVTNKNSCKMLEKEYTAEELKGIISKCDIFIGSRMHSTIASTSTIVPTVAIAYSHKTHGIIGGLLKQEKYVIDIKDLTYQNLITVIDDIWNNKDNVKRSLESEMLEIKEKSLVNAILIQNYTK